MCLTHIQCSANSPADAGHMRDDPPSDVLGVQAASSPRRTPSCILVNGLTPYRAQRTVFSEKLGSAGSARAISHRSRAQGKSMRGTIFFYPFLGTHNAHQRPLINVALSAASKLDWEVAFSKVTSQTPGLAHGWR